MHTRTGKPGSSSCENEDVYTRAVQSELLRYANETSSRECYKPSTTTLSQTQLRAAALEFLKRCDEGEDVCGLLVSRNLSVRESPSRQFEMEALAGTRIVKLWYAMTKANDLVIIKISSGDAHSRSVVRLISDLVAFSDQYGGIFDVDSDGDHVLLSGTIIAPDSFLQRIYPEQPPAVNTNPQLRAPLVVELEIGNRGPKALMEQLSVYLQQPESDYALGIKIYNRMGPPVPAGRRPFAAIAALWRRGNAALVGQQVQFVGVWSFGTGALHPNSVRAFATARENLAPIPQIVHPAPSLNIIIPGADLIQGAVDIHGSNVPLLPNGNDLVVHLGQIRDICDRRLPL